MFHPGEGRSLRTGTIRRLVRPLFVLLLLATLLTTSTPAYSIGVVCGGCRGRAEHLDLDSYQNVVFE